MFQFHVLLIFTVISITKSQEINDTCIDLSFENLNKEFQSAFLNVAETPIYNYAKVNYQVENSAGEIRDLPFKKRCGICESLVNRPNQL